MKPSDSTRTATRVPDSSLLAALPIPAFATDARGNVTFWSTSLEDLTGRTPAQMLGKKAWTGFFARKADTPLELALRSEDEEVDSAFVVTNRSTGEARTVRFEVKPVANGKTGPAGAVATLTKNGHDLAGEQAIEKLNNLPTPVVEIDREFGITFINKAGAKVLGSTPEELVGRKCYSLFKTAHCNTPECRCRQAMEKDGTFTGETVADPEGLNLPIQYTGTSVKDADGNVVGALEYVLNISDTKAAIDDAEEKVKLLNKIPTPVMAVDKEFNVTFMNPAGAGVVGKTPEEVVGKKCYDLFKTGHCRTAECRTRQAMERDGRFTGETVADPSSLNLPIRYTSAPVKDADGHIVGALEYVLDMTDEAQARDEIASLAHAAKQGTLDKRGDVESFSPEYQPLIAGINEMIDAVVQPIQETARVLDSLSQYDLRARMDGEYNGSYSEIKDSVNLTAQSLHDALAQVADAVDQVNSAGGQIAASSQSVAQGASEQAASLEQTTSSLEQMSGMTKQNADNTQQAKTLSTGTKEVARKGTGSMTEMMQAMEKIRQSAEGTAAIIKDINEIAFQTNLLALNAAVEAARAGDAGRGFAVVAEEVRNLAMRAKEAAGKTEGLIQGSVKLAEDGEKISKDVNANLTEIVDSVGKVSDIVGEIAAASEEQARGISQVSQAVAQMDKVTQQSAADAEESSSAAEELSGQAQELAALVGRFELARTAPQAVAPRPRQVRPGRHTTPGIHVNPEDVIPLESDPDFKEF